MFSYFRRQNWTRWGKTQSDCGLKTANRIFLKNSAASTLQLLYVTLQAEAGRNLGRGKILGDSFTGRSASQPQRSLTFNSYYYLNPAGKFPSAVFELNSGKAMTKLSYMSLGAVQAHNTLTAHSMPHRKPTSPSSSPGWIQGRPSAAKAPRQCHPAPNSCLFKVGVGIAQQLSGSE